MTDGFKYIHFPVSLLIRDAQLFSGALRDSIPLASGLTTEAEPETNGTGTTPVSMGTARSVLPLAPGPDRVQVRPTPTAMVTLTLATALPEEPDALIALVRVCGGVGG